MNRHRLTPKKIEFLKENIGLSNWKLAQLLGCDSKTIARLRVTLGLGLGGGSWRRGKSGVSLVPKEPYRPEGWTIEQRAPCNICEHHPKDWDDRADLCAYRCVARVEWEQANQGPLTRSE